MTALAVVFHSGYGHTAKVAEAVAAGVKNVEGVTVDVLPIDSEGNLPEGGWHLLAKADGIIFGSPIWADHLGSLRNLPMLLRNLGLVRSGRTKFLRVSPTQPV